MGKRKMWELARLKEKMVLCTLSPPTTSHSSRLTPSRAASSVPWAGLRAGAQHSRSSRALRSATYFWNKKHLAVGRALFKAFGSGRGFSEELVLEGQALADFVLRVVLPASRRVKLQSLCCGHSRARFGFLSSTQPLTFPKFVQALRVFNTLALQMGPAQEKRLGRAPGQEGLVGSLVIWNSSVAINETVWMRPLAQAIPKSLVACGSEFILKEIVTLSTARSYFLLP